MELEFVALQHASGQPTSRFFLRSEARRVVELLAPMTAFRVRCRVGDLPKAAPDSGYSGPQPTALGDVIVCRGIDAPHDPEFSHVAFVVRGIAGKRLFFSHASVRQYVRILEKIGEEHDVYTARFSLSGLDALETVARGGAISVDNCGIGAASIAVEHHEIPASGLRTHVNQLPT